jgi:hypothetical protein
VLTEWDDVPEMEKQPGQLAFDLDCSSRKITAASFAPGPEGQGGVFSCAVATLAEETVAALDRASREHIPVRLLFDDHSLLLDLVTLERKQPQSVRIIGQLIVAAAGKPPREETR